MGLGLLGLCLELGCHLLLRLQCLESLRRKNDGMDREVTRGVEFDVVEAAVGGIHLVLRADRFLEDVLLDLNTLIGQLFLGSHMAIQRVQGVQQADREGRAAAHPATGGQVAVMMNLDPAIEVHKIQRGAHRGMLYFFYGVGTLDLRVHHAKAMFKKRRQMSRANVAVLVNGRG